MLLFVGLGNPGPEYVATRHNIGFLAVQKIAERWSFKPWRRRFHGLYVEGTIEHEQVALLLPDTYMNDSGVSVLEAVTFYKLNLLSAFIFHDDIERSFGDIRLRLGGGMAGHKGLRSVTGLSGESKYHRVQLGIGRPPPRMSVHDYVLSNFRPSEMHLVDAMLMAIADNAPLLSRQDDMYFETKVLHELTAAGFEISKKRPKK